jgi:hypothetical protein
MKILEDSYQIISHILIKKELFRNSLNNFLLTNVRNSREIKDIETVYLLFFKHYYFYKKITQNFLSKATPSLITYIGVSFICTKYIKYNDINDSIAFLKIALKNNKEKYTEELEQALIDYKNNESYRLKNVKKGSIEYLSILFNLPTWFVQMILNQCNKDIARQVFNSFKGKIQNYYLQSKLENLDEIDNENLKSFKKCDNNLYLKDKDGQDLIKKNVFVKTNEFYEFIFKNDLKQINKYITLFQSEKGSFFYRFLNEYLYKNNVLNLAFASFYDNPDSIKNLSPKDINNLFICESTVGQLIAHLNFKQDIIFYIPKSTNFQKFYLCPEYSINFDQKDIDVFINEQKEGLKEISQFTAQNGFLVYAVETIDKKETSDVINGFLSIASDFELVKSEFVYPTYEKKIFGYYAILKRN